MWLFTKVGFFSVVLETYAKGKPRLMVRARVGKDLDALRATYAPKLSATKQEKGRDYPYRAFITHAEFAKVVAKLVTDIDYGNFKSMVAKEQGHPRSRLYHGVWDVMFGAEEKLAPRDVGALALSVEKEMEEDWEGVNVVSPAPEGFR